MQILERLFVTIPLWGLFALTVALVLLSMQVGVYLGQRRRRAAEHEHEGAVGAVVGATLGLLAFLLAFTFSISAARFDTRKQLVLDEATTIWSAYQHAGLVAEPHRTEVRQLLREYVRLRADLPANREQLMQALAQSEDLQHRLWAHAEALVASGHTTDIDANFCESISEVAALHTRRVTVGLQYRIPDQVWLILYLVTMVAMGMVGYQFGLSGPGSWRLNLALALAFSAVLLLNAGLDRVGEGSVRVSQQPLIELQQRLNNQ